MNQDTWTGVDRYISDLLVPADPALDAALRDSAAAGLPEISVSPAQGKLLQLLARMCSARRILEIGTLGGYSTIWLARALPADGQLITLEAEPKHAKIAQQNIDRAGLGSLVEVKLGKAMDTLPKLLDERNQTGRAFDLIFVDADKTNNADYFAWAVKLSRPGTVIVVDNVVRKGKILDTANTADDLTGTRRFYEALAAERRVSATAIQTVGIKGYDGFAIAVVEGER